MQQPLSIEMLPMQILQHPLNRGVGVARRCAPIWSGGKGMITIKRIRPFSSVKNLQSYVLGAAIDVANHLVASDDFIDLGHIGNLREPLQYLLLAGS